MRLLFALLLLALVAAGIATYRALPEHGDRPVLTWVVDTGPFRERQRDLFEKWMVDNGYPAVELRIDATNREITKKVVQSVSGVGGDIIDCFTGEVRRLQSLGVAEDITDMAAGNGFDVGSTFPAIVPELVVDGRQYAFPRNVGTVMVWCNREAFRRVGMEPPPRQWTVDDFERIGREFVTRSNPPGGPRTTYLMPQLGGDRIILIRSLGGDHYNETLTASAYDCPATIDIYKRSYQWTHVDRILPTKAEAKSLSADSGVVPITYHLFAEGKFGMMRAGRWGLMFFREVGIDDLSISEMPNFEFRNTRIGIGAAILYAGSKKKELAAYFFKFLASPEFNNLLIEGADALPPVPAFASGDAFNRPPGREDEWGLHEPFLEAALDYAIPLGVSPFVLASTVTRVEGDAYQRFMAGRLTAEEAVRKASDAIDREIARTANSTQAKKAQYAARIEDQRIIDELRAAGKPVPAELIRNPFHLKYYAWKGWLAEEPSSDPVDL